MANQIPFSGASNAAGGYILPFDQGELLTNALLQEAGALALAGDRRATAVRKEIFNIWLGAPTAGFVGEGAPKPVTGGEFGQTELHVKKIASIPLFTDEMLEDIASGDLNPLVDQGVRSAIADVIDAHIIGKDSGTNIESSFDTALRSTTLGVEYDASKADGLRLAVSAAMGKLEANGYRNQGQMGLLLGGDIAQAIRDARSVVETANPLYNGLTDPTYGLDVQYSTNLNGISETAGANKIVGLLVYKPNLHARIRKDVTVTPSNQATVNDGENDRHLFQENLTAIRYETRLGFMAHDINRAVVAIKNAS